MRLKLSLGSFQGGNSVNVNHKLTYVTTPSQFAKSCKRNTSVAVGFDVLSYKINDKKNTVRGFIALAELEFVISQRQHGSRLLVHMK